MPTVTAGQFRAVDAGFAGEDFAFHQRVIPLRIQMRILMRLQTDSVAEMMLTCLAARDFLKCSSTTR